MLVAGEPVADACQPRAVGHRGIGELRKPGERDRDEVLGPGLLLGVTPSTPLKSIGFVGSYGVGGTADGASVVAGTVEGFAEALVLFCTGAAVGDGAVGVVAVRRGDGGVRRVHGRRGAVVVTIGRRSVVCWWVPTVTIAGSVSAATKKPATDRFVSRCSGVRSGESNVPSAIPTTSTARPAPTASANWISSRTSNPSMNEIPRNRVRSQNVAAAALPSRPRIVSARVGRNKIAMPQQIWNAASHTNIVARKR